MNFISIYNWVETFCYHFRNKDTGEVLNLLQELLENAHNNPKSTRINDKKEEFRQRCHTIAYGVFRDHSVDTQELADFFFHISKALESYNAHEYSQGFTAFNDAYSCFTRLFKQQEGIWLLGPMKHLTRHLRIYATLAYNQTQNESFIVTSINSVRNLVSLMNLSKAAPAVSKRRGLVFCAKELGYMCFKIWKYSDCSKNIEDAEKFLRLPEIRSSDFSKSDLVALKYYEGRVALFDFHFVRAEHCLEEAFNKSHKNAFKNQRTILKYLIPAKVYCGKLPTVELIQKYKLFEYVLLVKAINEGNLSLYRAQIEKYRRIWIKRSIYLALEKLELILLRNLMKRVYNLFKKPIIDTDSFKIALNHGMKEVQYDIDETECIISNLILKGFIKGYISHDKRKVVFSKNDPFPKISKLIENGIIN